MDHIHFVNQVTEKSTEYTEPFYMAFIDYQKAFDSVQTASGLKALKDQGIERSYISLLDDIHKKCTGRITLHKQSGKFPIQEGVRQGDTMSPKLFTACLQGVYRKLDRENTGLRISAEYFSHLRFADDIVLLSETAEQLQNMLEEEQ